MTQPPCRAALHPEAGFEDLLRRHRLDPRQKAPLYVQLGQFLRECIHTGRLRPGTRLPTEKHLQQLCRVSRITVRQALDSLMREGLIRRRRGLGTQILAPRQEVVMDRRTGLEDALRARGRQVYRHHLDQSMIPADDDVAAFLQLVAGRPVRRRLFVLYVDGDRVACTAEFRRVTEEAPGPPALENGAAAPDPRHQTVEIVPASYPVADHLQVSEGTPVLRHVLGLYLEGRPVERQEHHYRSDCYRYRFRM